MHSVYRTLIVGYASEPVVYDEVVLQRVTPHDGVFKLSVDGRIYSLFGDLTVGFQAVAADPYASASAHHQTRTVVAACECEVAQTLDHGAVAPVEFELRVLPRAVEGVGYIVSADDIYDDTAVVETVCFWVVPLAYGLAYGIWAVQTLRDGVIYRRVGPEHVPLRRVLRPAAYVHVIEPVVVLKDIPTPE